MKYLCQLFLDASQDFRRRTHLGLLNISSLCCKVLRSDGGFISKALLFCCLTGSFFSSCLCSFFSSNLSSSHSLFFGPFALLLFCCGSLADRQQVTEKLLARYATKNSQHSSGIQYHCHLYRFKQQYSSWSFDQESPQA